MRNSYLRSVVLATGILLGGCQSLSTEPEVRAIEAQDSLIRFEHEDFQPELSDYAARRDPRTGNEWHVAGFHGMNARGVVAAWKAAPGYVVGDIPTETLMGHLLPDAELVWSGSGGANSALGYVEYRFFHVADDPAAASRSASTRARPGTTYGASRA